MSYSFSAVGTLNECRNGIDAIAYGEHGARQAKSLIHHQLDILQSAGATHARVTAYGHHDGGKHNIEIKRDFDAEKLAAEQAKVKAYEAWEAKGKEEGFLAESQQEDTLVIRRHRARKTTGADEAECNTASPAPVAMAIGLNPNYCPDEQKKAR